MLKNAELQIDALQVERDNLVVEVENYKKKYEDALNRLSELEQDYARLKAEFYNYRKRMEQQYEKLKKLASERIIKELLPVIDNFERAIQHAKDDDPLKQGVIMVYRQLLDVLCKEGLKSIESVGKSFDPVFHEAVAIAEGEEEGIVLEEYERGYILNEKLLRPAKVKVSKKSDSERSNSE